MSGGSVTGGTGVGADCATAAGTEDGVGEGIRVVVKTRVAVGIGVSREGVAGTKGVSTIGGGCEVGFGAADEAGLDEGGPDSVGTNFNDDQARYNSPANRET